MPVLVLFSGHETKAAQLPMLSIIVTIAIMRWLVLAAAVIVIAAIMINNIGKK